VNPTTWVEPRETREAVAYKVTPELVHGIAIRSPTLAESLRHCRAFSGKTLENVVPDVAVTLDHHGYVLAAVENH